MINKEKIKVMTKLAAYESREGKKNFKISSFYKSDYISWNVIKSFASATLAFLVCVGVYLIYDLETLLEGIYSMDLLLFLKEILSKYVIFVAIYLGFAYLYYSVEYQKIRLSLRGYYAKLNKLIKIYKEEREKK